MKQLEVLAWAGAIKTTMSTLRLRVIDIKFLGPQPQLTLL